MAVLVVVLFPVVLASAQEGSEEIPIFPNFNLIPLGGGESVNLESFSGRPLLLTFWASWCGPCRQELGELQKLAAELAPKGFAVVTVNVDDSQFAARRFLEVTGLELPVYRMTRADLVQLGVRAIPTNILLDGDRRPAMIYEGYAETVPGVIRDKVLEIVAEGEPKP